MNSAIKWQSLGTRSPLALVLAILVGFSGMACAQSAASAEVPPPSPNPMADSASETPDNYVGEGPAGGTEASASEVLRLLQQGNGGKPLTIADLAAINDAMKRMDYVVQLQRKMTEVGQAETNANSSNAPVPVSAPVASALDGGALSVVRISGSRGQYQALVSNGREQTFVKVGDTLGSAGRVSGISLSGVRVTTDSGSSSVLPFAAPAGIAGVTTGR